MGQASAGDPRRRRGLVPARRQALARRAPTTAMTHLAVTGTVDGKNVDMDGESQR
jgi:hypothetical protein